MLDAVLGHRDDDEIGEQGAVRVEVAGRDRCVLVRADDEDPAVGGDRRDRGAAPVEHDQVGLELLREPHAREHVRDPDRAREAAAAAPAADRRQAGERRRLEVVGRGVAPGAGELEQVGHGRPDLDDLGLGRARRAPSPRRRRAGRARASAPTWPVTAVLPTRFPVPITATEGVAIASKRGGSSRKSAPSYGTPSARARAASLNRAGGPSTGSSERSSTTSGACSAIAVLERGGERHAVVLAAAQLLRAADEHAGDDLVGQLDESIPDHGGVVLPVDHGDGPHERDVTSDSIRPVYFSYSKVSVENWMMRSCPWNGWRRQISTWLPVISITL